MKTCILLLACLCLGCASRHPIEDAKAVAKSHEELAKAGDLEGIMNNFADDYVGLVPGMPFIKGKDALRKFYGSVLSTGRSEFVHEYEGAEIVGDAVILHGIGRGTLTKADSSVDRFANNFILILKYQSDGKMKMWRGTFAPSSQ
jgi:ketosteroid isomerase-like protein